jgi:hypothetical protein
MTMIRPRVVTEHGERQILMPGDARIGLAGTSTRALLF